MTQEDLVTSSGVKQGTISKIERGDQHRTSYILELANALKINPEWLKDNQGSMESPPDKRIKEEAAAYNIPSDVTRALDALGGLTDDEVAVIVDVIMLIRKLRGPGSFG